MLKGIARSVAISAMFVATAASAQGFSIDAASPEVPARSPADIYLSDGSKPALTARNLGLDPADEVDAFSYGRDRIEPLGPNFFALVFYSVDRDSQGLQSDGRPGAGAVWRQVRGNGAAGDKFYLKAILGPPPIGMFPVSRGMRSDAPMHGLTPLPAPESRIDGLAVGEAKVGEPVYISVGRGGAAGQPWGPGDVIVVVPGDPPNSQPTARVWATAAQLGLTADDNIDALAILNGGADSFDAGDVVYASVDSASPARAFALGEEAVLQLSPPPVRVVFDASILNILATDELDALTGVDPGPDFAWLPPPKEPPPQEAPRQEPPPQKPKN